MKKQCFMLGLAFFLGSTSCTKESINSTKSTANALTDSVMLVSLSAKGSHKPTTVTVSTFAGSGLEGSADGNGASASFHTPLGLTVDISGNVYVADANNNKIRKISKNGAVTTLAGSGDRAFADGAAATASFSEPIGLAADGQGNIYVGDCFNNRIRKISRKGDVTTIAGSGLFASNNGNGIAASFKWPHGVALDDKGNVYVAGTVDCMIRKISPEGIVTTLAGSGAFGFADGLGTSASFNQPQGVAVDATGNVYVADTDNFRIRKISPDGLVTTLAGSGVRGADNGTGTAASFNSPEGIALDIFGNLIVADTGNHMIRKVSAEGVVTTLAGTGAQGVVNGPGTSALFNFPSSVAVDKVGNIYVAEIGSNMIRKIVLK